MTQIELMGASHSGVDILKIGNERLDPVMSTDRPRITEELSKDNVVMQLAGRRLGDNGQMAKRTFAIIERLEPPQQVTVLQGWNAVRGLANNGQAGQVVALIEKLSPEQQTAVLSASEAVSSLAFDGQAAETTALIQQLTPKQQATILAVQDVEYSLRKNGQQEGLKKIRESIQTSATSSPRARAQISTPGF
jgi:hypothetical protein